MTTPRTPILVNVTSIDQVLPIPTPTVIGIIGTGDPTATDFVGYNVPTAVNTLADAEAQFGAGTVRDAVRIAELLADVWVVGCMFDDTATDADVKGPERSAEIQISLDAMERAVTHTGRKPSILAIPNETYQGFALNSLGAATGGVSPAAAALQITCNNMKIIGIADGPPQPIIGATAISIPGDWMAANGGNRMLAIPQIVGIPGMAVTIAPPPGSYLNGSSYLAALMARNDALFGIADSFSNRPAGSIREVLPERSFEYTTDDNDAIVLRANNFTSLVRIVDGTWRVIGGTLKTASATDPLRYVGIRRMVDQVRDTVILFGQTRWQRSQDMNLISGLLGDVYDYLEALQTLKVISSFTARSITTPADNAGGLLRIAIELFFPAVNEQIEFDVEVSLV